MKKKHIIYTLSTIPLTIALGSVNDSNAFFGLDSFISKNKTANDIVNIRDKNLLKAINNQLRRGEVLDNVTIADMESLTILNAQERNISSIEGLEYAVNLRELNLGSNKLVNISLLRSLTNLTKLYLYDNQISDVSPLSNLTSLTELYIGYSGKNGNNIRNISSLSNLINLRKLNIEKNQISDISAISDLTNLTHLNLHSNKIVDISPLSSLINLKELSLAYNQISDMLMLGNLTNLNTLYLNNNQISNIPSLSNLTNLTYLNISNNQISDISSINSLTNLNTLYLNYNKISGISSLENLTNLNSLSLNNNQIVDISPLSGLTKLTNLSIQDNQIVDISPLSSLTKLTVLGMHSNQIVDISPLSSLDKLEHIDLGHNNVVDFSTISNLSNLRGLFLHDNKIFDISPISSFKGLTGLRLDTQKPMIELEDFKTKTNEADISIDNPIISLFNRVSSITNISNNGLYENGKLKWNSLPLGNHTRKFNFSENITVGSVTTTFSGTATLNFNVVDGGAPESDHTSDFDNSDFRIYTTVTANDLGVGVDYLMHKGVRQSLPYRFKYDILEPTNNIVEVYDLVGNKAEYQVKLKDSDIPTIEEGLDALVNKDSIEKEDISYFRTIINDLDESMNKDLLQDRLNDIYPKTLTLDRELTTSNTDVYIKPINTLIMSLSTNSITFEDFSGVEDMEKANAVNIAISSSLPYQLNAYLPVGIQNADKSNVMNKSILNIKENNESTYQTFANTADKMILKDNCLAGNDLIHGVDIKLKGGIAHEKDVYKTTIKFEAEQK